MKNANSSCLTIPTADCVKRLSTSAYYPLQDRLVSSLLHMAKERRMCFIMIGCMLEILLTSSTNTISYNLPTFLGGIT